MSDISAIAAELRERAGKGAARETRRTGKVPGVIYGGKQAPVCIALDPRVLWVELRKPGFKTRLFDVDLGAAGKHRCLARDVSFHPVSDQPIHIDFMRVSADVVVHVKVPVHAVNQDKAPGVKRGGVINLEHHDIEVTCAPDRIPHAIEIDLTGMEIGASIHLGQLKLPEGVTPYHLAADATILTLAPPTVARVEATEEAAAPAAV